MYFLVVYDISKNDIRLKISEILKNYGLKRIQKSAFLGTLKVTSLHSLITELSYLIVDDSVLLLPVCIEDLKNLRYVGKKFELEQNQDVEFY